MSDANYYLGRERQRDLLREAEIERENRAAMREGKQSSSALAWMGRRLVTIGKQMVEASGEKH